MEDEMYPWEEFPEQSYPEEENFDFDAVDELPPCHDCAFYDSILCEICTLAER